MSNTPQKITECIFLTRYLPPPGALTKRRGVGTDGDSLNFIIANFSRTSICSLYNNGMAKTSEATIEIRRCALCTRSPSCSLIILGGSGGGGFILVIDGALIFFICGGGGGGGGILVVGGGGGGRQPSNEEPTTAKFQSSFK